MKKTSGRFVRNTIDKFSLRREITGNMHFPVFMHFTDIRSLLHTRCIPGADDTHKF